MFVTQFEDLSRVSLVGCPLLNFQSMLNYGKEGVSCAVRSCAD